jgi:DnaJ-domain-containing protein 1
LTRSIDLLVNAADLSLTSHLTSNREPLISTIRPLEIFHNIIMPSKTEDLVDEPPTSINPYRVLDLEKDATADQIKTAYRKAALKNHPGKYFTKYLLTSCSDFTA